MVERSDGPPRSGIFTLANDAVFEWTAAFLRSVGCNSGGLPVTIIPFDDNRRRVDRLARAHGVEVWSPPLLHDLDELGARCYPTSPKHQHMFRKFAAFHGPYEKFAFFDSDIVVRSNFEPMLAGMMSADDLIVDCHSSPDVVYRPGAFRQQRIAKGARCFNAGFFMSVAGLAPLAELDTVMTRFLPHRGEMAPGVGDQPFLNFWAEETGLSILPIDQVAPGISRETWAGQSPDGTYTGRSPYIHWAGFRNSPSMPRVDLFLKYRCDNAVGRFAWKFRRTVADRSVQLRKGTRRAVGRLLRRRAARRPGAESEPG